MRILAFETSAKAASVALLEDGKLLGESYQNTGLTHSQTLMVMAQQLLEQCGKTVADITAVAVAAVAFLSEGLLTTNLLYASTALMVASAVAELVAGIVGVVNCKKPEKAGVCIVWGAIVAVLCVAGTVLNLVANGEFNIFTLAVGLVLPVLFIIGGVNNKKG